MKIPLMKKYSTTHHHQSNAPSSPPVIAPNTTKPAVTAASISKPPQGPLPWLPPFSMLPPQASVTDTSVFFLHGAATCRRLLFHILPPRLSLFPSHCAAISFFGEE